MIVVTLFCSKDGSVQEIKANGHARFAEKGRDIVCASVTVLLRTAGILFSELCESGKIEFSAEAEQRGNLAFRVKKISKDEFLSERIFAVLDFVRAGIKSLASEYPEFVRFVEEKE